MALMITFSQKESQKLMREWQHHYQLLRLSFEPAYHIGRHCPTISPDGKPLLITEWMHGRPTVMPPADVVSLILYNADQQLLQTYLIGQPELFEQLGWLMHNESLPTLHFRLEALTDPIRHRIIPQATLVDERSLEFMLSA